MAVARIRPPPVGPLDSAGTRPVRGARRAEPRVLNRGTLALLSAYFVVIWGAGYVASRAALQYAAPFTYIGVRYAIGAVLAFTLALALRARWPASPAQWGHIAVAGLLSHAGYLSGSHYAQYWGLSAGVTALILALQPLVTALIAVRWLGERLTRIQAVGVVVGLAGVALVVAHKFDLGAITLGSLAAVAWALVCVTAGTLYQRHFGHDADLRSSVVIHFAATALVMLPLGWAFEGFGIHWNWQIAATLAYHVIPASMGAYTVFHFLMRRGQATRVTSLLYLTPPVAALCEWLLFGVAPTALMLLGMVGACAGVAMVTRRTGGSSPG
ncbi:MAG TPA: DMT family transporter [Burkholderiaceae bacterium]